MILQILTTTNTTLGKLLEPISQFMFFTLLVSLGLMGVIILLKAIYDTGLSANMQDSSADPTDDPDNAPYYHLIEKCTDLSVWDSLQDIKSLCKLNKLSDYTSFVFKRCFYQYSFVNNKIAKKSNSTPYWLLTLLAIPYNQQLEMLKKAKLIFDNDPDFNGFKKPTAFSKLDECNDILNHHINDLDYNTNFINPNNMQKLSEKLTTLINLDNMLLLTQIMLINFPEKQIDLTNAINKKSNEFALLINLFTDQEFLFEYLRNVNSSVSAQKIDHVFLELNNYLCSLINTNCYQINALSENVRQQLKTNSTDQNLSNLVASYEQFKD